jgi:hypothetical protein
MVEKFNLRKESTHGNAEKRAQCVDDTKCPPDLSIPFRPCWATDAEMTFPK